MICHHQGSPSCPLADPSLYVWNHINRKMNIRPLYLISSNGTSSPHSPDSQRPTLTYQLSNPKIPKRSPHPSDTSPPLARMLQDRVRPGWKERDGAGKPRWPNTMGRRISPERRLEERIWRPLYQGIDRGNRTKGTNRRLNVERSILHVD